MTTAPTKEETALGVAVLPTRGGLVRRIAERFHVEDNKLIHALKSTVFRQSGDEKEQITDAQMLMLLIVVDQYGLNPFTKEIFAFPDKKAGIVPIVSVDGWSRIINDNEQMDGMHFVVPSEGFVTEAGAKPCPAWMECVIYRKDRKEPIRVKEYLDECYRPPFKKKEGSKVIYEIPGPWQSHTKRMLRHKAMIQGARLAFGFVGIYDYDEGRSIIEGEVADIVDGELIEAEPKSRTETAKDTLKQKAQADQAAINDATPGAPKKGDPDFKLPEDYGTETETTDGNKDGKKE